MVVNRRFGYSHQQGATAAHRELPQASRNLRGLAGTHQLGAIP
jgi:hypothetical protein